MNNEQVKILLFFIILIILILLITFFYRGCNSQESFADLSNDQDGQDNPDVPDVSTEFKNEYNTFKNYLNRFSNIDIPVTLNNTGAICSDWGDYEGGKYAADGNRCLVLPGKSIRQCLIGNKTTSCANYYRSGSIDDFNALEIDNIYDVFMSRVNAKSELIMKKLNNKVTEIDKYLDTLIDKKNIENQQAYFIDYNDLNVQDKKKYLDKTTTDFNKLDNDIMVNQVNFSNTVEKNKKEEKENNFYYNVMKYIFYTILVVAIANLLFSDIL